MEAIIEAGGTVVYDYQKPSFVTGLLSGGQFKPVEEPTGPAFLRNLLGENFFSEVYAVHHYNAAISDGELELLDRFPQLEHLSLAGCHLSVAGVKRLSRLTTLRDLTLAGARPSDNEATGFDFGQLEALTQLLGLGLGNTSVNDRDLPHIGKLVHLTSLFLDRSNVTDTGLEELKGLTHLQYLSVNNTRVTADGLKRFHAALPKCTIGHSLGRAIAEGLSVAH